MVKNELEQREGFLLLVPRRIAVLSSASNSREIQPPKACGCVHSAPQEPPHTVSDQLNL